MRPRFYLILLALLLTLAFIASRVVAFVQLFFEHSGIAITQREIKDAHTKSSPDTGKQHIPKIIHQVFHDWRNHSEPMPDDWEELRHTCIDLNEGWEYKLWTEQSSRDFIQTKYPWFLKTYDGYQLPVQRVDTVRYFILRYYGGIYLDLDNGCLENLEPLLYYPSWTTDGGRGALSNNILGAAPNHPFWILLTDSLIPYNYNYFFPYITISYASGQWFETSIWQRYHAALPPPSSGEENRLYRIMMDDRPGTEPWIFFNQMRGGSWVNWDNRMFLWIGDHLILLGLVVVGAVGLVGWGCMRICGRGRGKKGYSRLDKNEDRSV